VISDNSPQLEGMEIEEEEEGAIRKGANNYRVHSNPSKNQKSLF
jgi:hypothetical protein